MINLTISEAMTAADGQLVHCEDPAYIGDMLIEGITTAAKLNPTGCLSQIRASGRTGTIMLNPHGAAVPPQQWLNMNLTFRFRRSLLKTACAQCSALQAAYAKRAA